MDLTKFEFPKSNNVEMAFSTYKTNAQLLAEAKSRDFYNGHTKYNSLFSKLFFNGGKVKFKSGIDEKFQSEAWAYCRAFMKSYEPKHEEKEAICAMIMSEILEPELES